VWEWHDCELSVGMREEEKVTPLVLDCCYCGGAAVHEMHVMRQQILM